eukprot:13065417-Alexandrium_andersonii.AAC.1
MQIDELSMAIKELCTRCLGEDIHWILLPWPLQQLKVSGAGSLLHPELPDGQVSDAPDSRAPANPNCRAAVGAYIPAGRR